MPCHATLRQAQALHGSDRGIAEIPVAMWPNSIQPARKYGYLRRVHPANWRTISIRFELQEAGEICETTPAAAKPRKSGGEVPIARSRANRKTADAFSVGGPNQMT